MSKLPIVILPAPLLRTQSRPIERVDGELLRLMDDMLETMYAAPGIGLAAIQVGVPRRLLVVDVAKDVEPKTPVCMVNPEVVEVIGDELRLHEEGCLSIPDVFAELERPSKVRVRFVGRDGKVQEMVCEGLLATVVQHEIDHLNGKLFIDYLSRLKRDRIIKKFVKAKREAENALS